MDNVNELSNIQRRLLSYTNTTIELLRAEPSLIDAEEALFWILVIWGLLANIAVAFVIIKNKKVLLEMPSNVLLLNLAIADIMCLAAISILRVVSSATQADRASASVSTSYDSALVQCQSMLSNWTVAVLVVFQWAAVCCPIRLSAFATRKRALQIVVVVWLMTGALSIPLLFMLKPGDVISSRNVSYDISVEGNMDAVIIYINVFDCLSQFPPILAILCLYPVIYQKLRKSMENDSRTENTRERMEKSLRHVTTVYSHFMLYLSFHFIVYFILAHFVLIRDPYTPYSDSELVSIKFLAVILVPSQLCYTIVNPVIHALVTEKFKKYYLSQWCRKAMGDESSVKSQPPRIFSSDAKKELPVSESTR